MDSNLGETGVGSIRLGGHRIENLPIAENALARPQLKDVLATQKINKINDVLAKYPKQSAAYLKGRIAEAEENARRIAAMKARETQVISEYSGLIALCEHRDREIEKNPSRKQEMLLQFPPYDVPAMRLQIEQCKQSIARGDAVIKREYESVAELRELLGLCEQRDAELRALGATVA